MSVDRASPHSNSDSFQAGVISMPISVLESWPAPNYVNPVKHPPTVIAWASILGTLAILATIGRLWSRFRLQRNAGMDDYFFLASLPCATALVVSTLVNNLNHLNVHSWDIMPSDAEAIAQLNWILQLEYLLSTGFIKQSLLLFYLRITSRMACRATNFLIWGMIIFQACTTITWFSIAVFSCTPDPSAYWKRFNPEWAASHQDKFRCTVGGREPMIILSIISVVQDFICAGLPLILISRLKVTFRQKVALFFTFVFGFGICAIGAVRLDSIYKAWFLTYDLGWYGYTVWSASIVEVLIAIIVSSLPSLKFYLRNYFDESRSSSRDIEENKPTGHAHMLESSQVMTKTMASKVRSLAFISHNRTNMASQASTCADSQSLNMAVGVTPLDITVTAATQMEADFIADVAETLPERTPSRQEKELRRSGIIAPDKWQWDVSELQEQRTPSRQEKQLRQSGILKEDPYMAVQWEVAAMQERTPSRQERELRRAGILKKDEWSDWDVADLQGKSPSFIERELRASGIVAKDEWTDWDGGKILQEGETALENKLLADGILTPGPAAMEGQSYFFAAPDTTASRLKARKRSSP